MKHLKIAGLCLVSMLVVGMTLAGNASAALLWLLCLEGSGLTKYEDNQCTKASGAGKWQSSGLPAGVSDTVRLLAFSLRVEDTGTGAIVECPDAGTGWGSIESPNKGQIKVAEVKEPEKAGCKVVKGFLTCAAGKLEKLEGRNLPWKTEIFETEKKNLTKLGAGSGGKPPGWSVTCGGATDECVEEEGKPESFELNNGVTKGVLLVLAIFEKKRKQKCTVGGKETGVIGGLLAVLLWNGSGLSIGTGVPPQPPVAPSIEQINFEKNIEITIDHEKNATPEAAVEIEKYGADTNIEWSVSAGDKKNWPIAYVRNTKIPLKEVRFSIEESTRKFLEEKLNAGSKVPIVGELTLGGTKLTFEKVFTAEELKEQAEKNKTYITASMESDIALPNEVHLYKAAKIIWKWTVKEGSNTFEQELGTSEHNLYLTLAKPVKKEGVAIPVYLTVLDLDTQGIEKEATAQPPDEEEAIKGIYSEFKSRKVGLRWYEVPTGVLNRGGKLLTYYEEIATGKTLKTYLATVTNRTCEGTATAALLEKGQGQCHAWAEILSYALAYEGITSALRGIEAEFTEPAEGCENVGTCGFLVKEWEFDTEKTGPIFPYRATDVKDIAGVEGQGEIKNPQSVFKNHFIVEAKKGGKTLYDPSYGTGPFEGASPLKTYQVDSMSGFCGRPEAVTFEAECQKSPATQQLAFVSTESFE